MAGRRRTRRACWSTCRRTNTVMNRWVPHSGSRTPFGRPKQVQAIAGSHVASRAARLLEHVPPNKYVMNRWVHSGSRTPFGRPKQVQAIAGSHVASRHPEPEQTIVKQARATRVWYEYGVATATGGYDPEKNRTLISRFTSLPLVPMTCRATQRVTHRRACARLMVAAVEAFNDAPSPRVGARVAAAYSAFHGSLEACLTSAGFAKAYSGRFEIGFVRRGFWEPGLRLKFHAESPSTINYEPQRRKRSTSIFAQQDHRILHQCSENSGHPPPDQTAGGTWQIPQDLSRSERAAQPCRQCSVRGREAGKTHRRGVGEEAYRATKRLGSEAEIGPELLLIPVLVDGEAAKGVNAVVPGSITNSLGRDDGTMRAALQLEADVQRTSSRLVLLTRSNLMLVTAYRPRVSLSGGVATAGALARTQSLSPSV